MLRGSSSGLIGPCCHGNDEAKVYKQLFGLPDSPAIPVSLAEYRRSNYHARMEISLERLWEKLKQIQALLPFLSAFEKTFSDGEIYLVGGAVRDLLLGRETKDYDFLVRGVPANQLGRFLSQHGKVNWVGKSFGVYKFMPTQSPLNEAIDIALPRTEESFSQGGGYRDFEIQSDPNLPVEEDLRRRDFTINAMAADLKNNILIDPFNGLDDLRASLLRAVGEATRRFSEDSSRLLRGLRFAAQLDLKFEAHSWAALKKLIPSINARRKVAGGEETFVVPRETIAKEFIKAMVLHPVRAYDLWDESGAFEALIPELLPMKGCAQPANYHSEGDVWIHTRLALSQLTTPEFQAEFGETLNAETVLAVLFHDIAKPVTIQTPEKDGTDRIRFNGHDHIGAKMVKRIATRLKLYSFPKGSRYYVDGDHLCWLVQKHLILVQGNIEQMRSATIEKYFLNPLLPGEKLLQLIYCDGKATVPEDEKTKFLHYWQIKKRIEKIAALSAEKAKIPRALLSGRDVMQILNVPSGPEIGKYLGLIREEQLSGRISIREEAVSFLKEYLN